MVALVAGVGVVVVVVTMTKTGASVVGGGSICGSFVLLEAL